MLLSSEFLLICLGSKWHNQVPLQLLWMSDFIYFVSFHAQTPPRTLLFACMIMSIFIHVLRGKNIPLSKAQYGVWIPSWRPHTATQKKNRDKGKERWKEMSRHICCHGKVEQKYTPHMALLILNSYCCKNETAETCEHPAVVRAVFSRRGAIERPGMCSSRSSLPKCDWKSSYVVALVDLWVVRLRKPAHDLVMRRGASLAASLAVARVFRSESEAQLQSSTMHETWIDKGQLRATHSSSTMHTAPTLPILLGLPVAAAISHPSLSRWICNFYYTTLTPPKKQKDKNMSSEGTIKD